MADETITVPSFDLGIESSGNYGNLDAAEAFLSGDPKEIEKIEEEEEGVITAPKKEVKKEVPKKKEEEKEVDKEELINTLLSEEKEEEEEEEKIIKEDGEEPKGELNHFEVFSEELYKLGSFTTDDGEEPVIAKTPEEFLELFNAQKQKGATEWLENFLSKHGDDRRELFDAIFINGANPQEYLPVYNEVENFQNLDLDTEDNQESVVRSYYTKMGWEKDEVDSKVEKLKQYADLEDEAKRVHPKLVLQEQKKLEELNETAKNKQLAVAQADQEYKQHLTTLLQDKLKTKDFDGIPLDNKKATQAFDFLYNKKWKLPSGELLTDWDKFVLETKNPENISKRVKMALLALNDFDFSSIKKTAITGKSSELFSKLAIKDAKQSNTKKQVDNSAWANIK